MCVTRPFECRTHSDRSVNAHEVDVESRALADKIVRPEMSAILFDRVWIVPWKAYLARYPNLQIVIIVDGENWHRSRRERVMHVDALEGTEGWKRVFATQLHVHDDKPVDCAVYERS